MKSDNPTAKAGGESSHAGGSKLSVQINFLLSSQLKRTGSQKDRNHARQQDCCKCGPLLHEQVPGSQAEDEKGGSGPQRSADRQVRQPAPVTRFRDRTASDPHQKPKKANRPE